MRVAEVFGSETDQDLLGDPSIVSPRLRRQARMISSLIEEAYQDYKQGLVRGLDDVTAFKQAVFWSMSDRLTIAEEED